MNKLPVATRVQILSMLVEGSSLRSISRITGVSINSGSKLLVDAGKVCSDFHDKHVVGVQSKSIQCDEIWSFCYAKEKNVKHASAAPELSGDVWTWTAIDADTKLIASWLVGSRGSHAAIMFLNDLRARVVGKPQITTDGHNVYPHAMARAFGTEIDYAQLIKVFGPTPGGKDSKYSPPSIIGTQTRTVSGNPDARQVVARPGGDKGRPKQHTEPGTQQPETQGARRNQGHNLLCRALHLGIWQGKQLAKAGNHDQLVRHYR